MLEQLKPKRIKKGDTVGVIAPASPPKKEALQKALSFLEQDLGLTVKMGSHIYKEYGYLAGEDAERVEDLEAMFKDEDVKAIICACGGYGTARIADAINYEVIRNNPKIFWGYSDITFIHTAIRQKTGLVTFHGPMLASDLGNDDIHPRSKESFKQLFQSEEVNYKEDISPLHPFIEGEAEGELVGGNLSLITTTLGTPFEIDTKGKLLLIEDIYEEPRNIDIFLNHLWLAGKLSDIAGLVIGDFANCDPKSRRTLTLDEVLTHYTKLINKPAMSGFKIGHCNPHVGIPLGVKAKISTAEKTLTIESGIADEN
ncbi:LD-carboxypeptidase [Pradoshia sp. D12]|uniref:S66 peptidase family protein n=1 Tax=Bacillaceae TaxID=186817 RepID=UPI00080AFCD2|nr:MULTISPECIES: LD-carboxypeptidase [Bacillaceae]OCA89843.1 LD-carboxypeptidase [Bacillus sp. FJAT-27986]QFK70758.1 LD-carboxypeptidase [Pradoshia sp. D12]TPF72550.1 LD-carboxypeptidase [Bacillus sp. D12]